jgi:hypothetical protein
VVVTAAALAAMFLFVQALVMARSAAISALCRVLRD